MQLAITILSLVATQFAVGFVLYIFYRTNRNIEAAYWWALCLFSVSLAWLFSLARVLLPDWVSVIFGNAFYLLGSLFILLGTQVYFGHRAKVHEGLLPVLLAIVLSMFFYWVYDLIVVRIVLISFVGAAYLVAAVSYFIRSYQSHAAYIGAIASLLLVIVSLCLYGALTVIYAPSPSEFFSFPGNVGLFIMQPSATIGFGLFGLLLLMLRLNTELQSQAQTDSLTQVFNRQGFVGVADASFKLAMQTQAPLSLMYLQIDSFKLINERWGHKVADEVLLDAVGKVKSELRGQGIICRYAGVQFLVLVPDLKAAELAEISARIRTCLIENPISLKGLDVVVSYSSGIAEISIADSGVEDLIDRAGEQLNNAIEQGRNRDSLLPA